MPVKSPEERAARRAARALALRTLRRERRRYTNSPRRFRGVHRNGGAMPPRLPVPHIHDRVRERVDRPNGTGQPLARCWAFVACWARWTGCTVTFGRESDTDLHECRVGGVPRGVGESVGRAVIDAADTLIAVARDTGPAVGVTRALCRALWRPKRGAERAAGVGLDALRATWGAAAPWSGLLLVTVRRRGRWWSVFSMPGYAVVAIRPDTLQWKAAYILDPGADLRYSRVTG